MSFPKNFMWGASSSSAQIEGAYDVDGKGLTTWDYDKKRINPGCCSFKYASDFYHHYKEDIALMAEMGFKMFRMSISWARILPDGESNVNPEGIKFYKDVFKECHKYGIEPLVTIYHFDLPAALEEKYNGWHSRKTAEAYLKYCRVIFENFKDDVHYWLTNNEYNVMIYYGAVDMLTGKANNLNALYNTGHIQLVAMAKAISLCHEMCPDAKIGPAPNLCACYPASADPKDTIAAMNMEDLRNNMWVDPLVFGKYPKSIYHYFELNNIVLDIQDGDMEALKNCNPDFIGFNCYGNETIEHCDYYEIDWNSMVGADNRDMSYLVKLTEKPGVGKAVSNPFFSKGEDGHKFDPSCIRVTARKLSDRYNLPLIITENGYGRPDKLEDDGSVHDSYRIEHLKGMISEMGKGIDEGALLFGYCPWSAVDLVSTREGISKRYGFIYVDRDEDDEKAMHSPMKRYRKDSFYWYKEVIASNGKDLGE